MGRAGASGRVWSSSNSDRGCKTVVEIVNNVIFSSL